MTKRVITTWVAISLGFLAAAPAHATIGSVISSFGLPGGGYAYGIYAERQYLYLSSQLTYGDYIVTFTHSGSIVRSVKIDGSNPYALYSGSRTHLGSGYVALCSASPTQINIFRLTGGSPVTSFNVSGGQNNFWDGVYYYVNGRSDRNRFVRYTRYGAPAGTWTCSGFSPYPNCAGAEYAQRGNKGEGPYFVISPGSYVRPLGMTTFPAGSLVKTWIETGGAVKHLAYGDSSNPGVYGAAIWAVQNAPDRVIEIDIDARGASSVVPASVGKIKAIYR